MLRETLPADIEPLCALSEKTAIFYDFEIAMLREVLDDYFTDREPGHVCRTWEDGQIRGFIYYAPVEMTDQTWEIWWLVVDPDSQGQGLGKKMMAEAERDLKRKGTRLLLVETSSIPRYEPTHHFYRKIGYIEAARIPDFYVEGDDKIIFWKKLTQ